MMIQEYTFESGRDFGAIMVCEHCGGTQKNGHGYNDSNYHNNVIPAMCCEKCGKSSADEVSALQFREFGSIEELEQSVIEDEVSFDKAAKYKTFFATFGSGKALKKRYVGIIAVSLETAHEAMHEIFGTKWSHMYRGADLRSSVLRFDYKPLIYIKVRHYSNDSYEVVEIEAADYLAVLEQEAA